VPTDGATVPSEHTFLATKSSGDVSALLLRPEKARGLYVFAHGAGAGMRHRFMEAVAERLAGHRLATFRYQFPYMEAGRKGPNPAPILVKTVRSAVAEASRLAPDLRLVAGGKSMGGRMTSTAAAAESLGARYVRKPKLSREGANVSWVDGGIAIEETPGDYGEEGHVYQAAVDLPKFDGNRAVLGVWVVDHEPAGLPGAIVDGFQADPLRNTVLFFQHSGGAIGRVAANATAFPHRRSTHNMLAIVTWSLDDDAGPHMNYLRGFWSGMEPYTNGYYTNETADEGQSVVDDNYQGNLPRLRQIKTKYDPKNLFRLNANVRPA
jgi:hypothetical protein